MTTAIAKGSRSKLIYQTETTYGTARTSVAYQSLLFSTESLIEQIETFKSQDIRPDRTTAAVRGGNIASGGSITSDFAIRRHAELLLHVLAGTRPTAVTITPTAITGTMAFVRGTYYSISSKLFVAMGSTATTVDSAPCSDLGAVTVVGGATGITFASSEVIKFMYVGTTGANTASKYTVNGGISFPTGGLAFEKQVLGGSAPLYVLYNGGRIDSVDLAITQKEIVKATWGIDFLSSISSNSASPANPSSVTLPTDDPVSGFDAFISLNGGVTFRPLKEASLSIKNNVEKDVNVIGSRTRLDLPEGIREISGSITTFFSDTTEYDLFKNETVIPVIISFIHNGEVLQLTLNEVKLTGSGTPQIGGQGTVTASFDITAFKQASANDITLDISVVNNTTLYTLPA